jgi:CBS domain containing-hemolysin-like protein
MTTPVWVGLAVLILANALYVAAEFGAVGVRRSRVRRLAEDGNRRARRLLPYVDNPAQLDRYVGASQIGITLSSLGLGAFAQATVTVGFAPVVGGWFDLDTAAALSISAVVVLLTLTAVQLILGELAPKAIALQYPTKTALATVFPMRWSLRVFRPFLTVLNGSATLLLRAIGVGGQSHRHLHSPEEIDLLIAESRDGGMLEPEEQARLRRALHLGLRTAGDLMVPLARLTTLPIEASWDTVVQTVAASPFSRLPVFRGTPDQIVGTLRVKDLVGRYVAEGPQALGQLVRPLPRVAHSLPADRVLVLLRERRAHQAIVVDPTDQVVGLVTIQDVLGELLNPRPPDRVPKA